MYLEYTDFGNKTNRGGLKHMKVDNKAVRQYENTDDGEHCIVNILRNTLAFCQHVINNFTSVHFLTMVRVFQNLVNSLLDEIGWRKSFLKCARPQAYKAVKQATQERSRVQLYSTKRTSVTS